MMWFEDAQNPITREDIHKIFKLWDSFQQRPDPPIPMTHEVYNDYLRWKITK